MKNRTFLSEIPVASADPVLGVTEQFVKDTRPEKVNLGVGVYQNAEGKAVKLAVVRKAEAILMESDLSATYGPIDGVKEFNRDSAELVFGASSKLLSDGRVTTVQSPGGTGAVRLGAELIRLFSPVKKALISDPTWDNHNQIFQISGFETAQYPYYDSAIRGFHFDKIASTIRSASAGTVVVLHASCHNPTGSDLSRDQWNEIYSICQEKALIPFLDFAYQGFADGVEEDASVIRMFAESGMPVFVAHSFSKNFGLYAERVGALSVVNADSKEATATLSQVKRIVRTIYSNPPLRGGKIVHTVLSDSHMRKEWLDEVTTMRNRLKAMRTLFVDGLAKAGVDGDFSHVLKQRGMFSYSGLSKEVVLWLREHKAIYALESGRICVAALNEKNVPHVCESIAQAIKAVS